MSDERRKYIRHPLSYPLKTKIIHERGKQYEDELVGESENVGAGGLQYKSREKLGIGMDVEIDLKVEKREFSLDGIVVRCDQDENGLYNIAVSFNNPSERLKARMAEQVVRIEVFKNRLERRYGVKLEFSSVAKEWIKRYSTLFARHYDL